MSAERIQKEIIATQAHRFSQMKGLHPIIAKDLIRRFRRNRRTRNARLGIARGYSRD